MPMMPNWMPDRVHWWWEGLMIRLSPKRNWHRLFGHPLAQRVGPWCNCMGVYRVDYECVADDTVSTERG